MKKLYFGKTKDVFLMEDGNLLLRFKDSVTGDSGVIDSGGNKVVGEVSGKGMASLDLCLHYLKLLEEAGLPTHFVAKGTEEGTLIVKNAHPLHIEVICRLKAWGSFVRRYGKYIEEGKDLPYYIEFTLKDDEREDPLITEDGLRILKIATPQEIAAIKEMTVKATKIVEADLKEKNLSLIDIKYEFGEVDGKIIMIDEISGDTMRVMKDGEILFQKDLAKLVLT